LLVARLMVIDELVLLFQCDVGGFQCFGQFDYAHPQGLLLAGTVRYVVGQSCLGGKTLFQLVA
jgi:hypothetical protein